MQRKRQITQFWDGQVVPEDGGTAVHEIDWGSYSGGTLRIVPAAACDVLVEVEYDGTNFRTQYSDSNVASEKVYAIGPANKVKVTVTNNAAADSGANDTTVDGEFYPAYDL